MDGPRERRYFPATPLGGCLYLDGQDFAYWTERQVDMILNRGVGSRKVETAEELHRLLPVVRGLPSVSIWIFEGLEAVAQRLQD